MMSIKQKNLITNQDDKSYCVLSYALIYRSYQILN